MFSFLSFPEVFIPHEFSGPALTGRNLPGQNGSSKPACSSCRKSFQVPEWTGYIPSNREHFSQKKKYVSQKEMLLQSRNVQCSTLLPDLPGPSRANMM
jgi:hypothetical protein